MLAVLILIILVFFGLLGWWRWREGRYLKKDTREAMDQRFRKTIDTETQDTLRRRDKFKKSLKRHGF